MARKPRILDPELEWQYIHLVFKASEIFHPSDNYPMAGKHKKKLIEHLFQFLKLFIGVEVLGFSTLSNHQHVLVAVKKDLDISLKDTARLYEECYGRKIDARSHACHKMRSNLNNISDFASHVEWHFAYWYNRQCRPFKRQGNFWKPRFFSTLLCTPKALFDCWLYIQINPVKIKKLRINHPNDYQFGTMGTTNQEHKDECMQNFYKHYSRLQGTLKTVYSFEDFLKLVDSCIEEQIRKLKGDPVGYIEENSMWTKGRIVGPEGRIIQCLQDQQFKHRPYRHGDHFSAAC